MQNNTKVNNQPSDIYSGLELPTRTINMNWKIKISGSDYNTLAGVSGLIELIGIELTNKLIFRAAKSLDDKTECRLRRGLKVTFYVH